MKMIMKPTNVVQTSMATNKLEDSMILTTELLKTTQPLAMADTRQEHKVTGVNGTNSRANNRQTTIHIQIQTKAIIPSHSSTLSRTVSKDSTKATIQAKMTSALNQQATRAMQSAYRIALPRLGQM